MNRPTSRPVAAIAILGVALLLAACTRTGGAGAAASDAGRVGGPKPRRLRRRISGRLGRGVRRRPRVVPDEPAGCAAGR